MSTTSIHISLTISDYVELTDALQGIVYDRISDLTVTDGTADYFEHKKRLDHAIAVLASVCENRVEIPVTGIYKEQALVNDRWNTQAVWNLTESQARNKVKQAIRMERKETHTPVTAIRVIDDMGIVVCEEEV